MVRLTGIALVLAMVLPGIVALANAADTSQPHRTAVVGTADKPVYLGRKTIVATPLPAAPAGSIAAD